MQNSEINVLVNGNRCKIYVHEGKTYIEGKSGSEYEIEVKNNTPNRIEAVATVDGLSVMSGSPGKDSDVGYVISPWQSYRIKGFRYSDSNVGAFRFNKKHSSYAASKQDGSEINCGVIACRIYTEKVPVQQIYTTRKFIPRTVWDEVWYYDNIPSGTAASGGLYGPGRFGYSTDICRGSSALSSTSEGPVKMSYSTGNDISADQGILNYHSYTDAAEVFSLGTEWGSDKVSKVSPTTFIRDYMSNSFEIYYTDREGLIALGVPLATPAKVNFPEGFPGNYAKPPVGWTR